MAIFLIIIHVKSSILLTLENRKKKNTVIKTHTFYINSQQTQSPRDRHNARTDKKWTFINENYMLVMLVTRENF